MAVIVWDGSESTDPENGDNWVGGVKPGAGDIGTFSDQGNGNCTFTAGVTWAGMNVTADYSGDIDFNDLNHSFGDMTFDGTGTVLCGTGTITCSGNFDNQHQTTWTEETSTLVMNGAAKTILAGFANDIYNLTIDGTITLDAATTARLDLLGALIINAAKSLTLNQSFRGYWGSTTINGTLSIANGKVAELGTPTINIGAAGVVTGLGTIITPTAGTTITLAGGGTFAPALVDAQRNVTLSAGTWGGAWTCIQGFLDRTFTLGGNCIFTGDVSFDADKNTGNTYTIDCATNDVDVEFLGDLDLTESGGDTLFWDKAATGTVKFGGAGAQVYTDSTAAIQDLGNVVHDGAGSLQLAAGDTMECTKFDGDAGTLDLNGGTLDCGGAMDWAAGYVIADPVGSTFDVLGAFTANAQDISGATAEWFLQCHDTAVASGAGKVANSNAGGAGHTEIDASVPGWTDSGGNTNWKFPGAPPAGGPAPHYTRRRMTGGMIAMGN